MIKPATTPMLSALIVFAFLAGSCSGQAPDTSVETTDQANSAADTSATQYHASSPVSGPSNKTLVTVMPPTMVAIGYGDSALDVLLPTGSKANPLQVQFALSPSCPLAPLVSLQVRSQADGKWYPPTIEQYNFFRHQSESISAIKVLFRQTSYTMLNCQMSIVGELQTPQVDPGVPSAPVSCAPQACTGQPVPMIACAPGYMTVIDCINAGWGCMPRVECKAQPSTWGTPN